MLTRLSWTLAEDSLVDRFVRGLVAGRFQNAKAAARSCINLEIWGRWGC